MRTETDLHLYPLESLDAGLSAEGGGGEAGGAWDVSRLPRWSARGCVQTLAPLYPPKLYRTLDGRLEDLSRPEHRKYRTTLTCQDKQPPALEGLWTGMAMMVDCLQHLICPLTPQQERVILDRVPVPGSVMLQQPEGACSAIDAQGQTVTLKEVYVPHSFLSYRPRLHMRLTHFALETNEWQLQASWRLELEEI